MLTINPKTAFDAINLRDIKDPAVKNAFFALAKLLHAQFDLVATVINANAITYVSQAAQPVPDEGSFIIWKDSDAAPGNPKAYIVTKQDGATYTFASEELV